MKFEERDKTLIVYTDKHPNVADHNYQLEIERFTSKVFSNPAKR